MKYINAETIFPQQLLKEIQTYIPGGILYIPKPEESHEKWGQSSGSREYLNTRNEEIRQRFSKGSSMDELSDAFCLSYHSIKKIVYSKNKDSI
ncbi:CD3324 family protein [Paenibacillus filicis]|uniref:CD3324 family protein n=1 Tax=Paenibacillus filicis TaxID=669464 RepID=A0ABU9DPA4_9BACL